MKKITLKALGILLLSFFGFASANAQITLGTYAGGTFTAGGVTNVNPNEPFNLAVKVNDDATELKAELDGTNLRIAFTSFRYENRATGAITNFTNNDGIRFTPVGSNYIYILENFDAVGANPLYCMEGDLHTGWLVAGSGVAGETNADYWWGDNTATNPEHNYLYVGTFIAPEAPGGCFKDETVATVDIVKIAGFAGDNAGEPTIPQYYVADNGTAIIWTKTESTATQWYQIPAGEVEGQQGYYFMNVETGRFLYLADLLEDRGGDWPITAATASATLEKTAAYKWFIRESNWDWGIHITSAAGINMSAAEGNQYVSLTSIILMKINDNGGVESTDLEFSGVHFPAASFGCFKGGLTNAWTATKILEIVTEAVDNPLPPTELVDFTGTIVALDATTKEPTVANPNAPYIIQVKVTEPFWQELLDREVTETFDDTFLGVVGAQGFFTVALVDTRFVVNGDTLTTGSRNTPITFDASFGREGRLYKSETDEYTYFANVPALETPLANGTTGEIRFTIIIAAMAKWGYWWNNNPMDGVNQTRGLSVDFATGGTGIETLVADDATIVGYFSITGAKLQAEPANGIFIIKYSNGKAVKVVK